MTENEVDELTEGEMMDLIACYQIAEKGAEQDFPFDDDFDIPDLK